MGKTLAFGMSAMPKLDDGKISMARLLGRLSCICTLEKACRFHEGRLSGEMRPLATDKPHMWQTGWELHWARV